MSVERYRVVQWATGKVGQVAIRHFAENPAFELSGVFVTNPEKVGKDAGELAGIGPTGTMATGDPEEILTLDVSCVHFSPLVADVDMVCRLLRSGKNVVSPLGPFSLTEFSRADVGAIDAAGREGGASFHGSGIQPGYIGDIVPLTLSRIVGRVDQVRVYEIVNYLEHPSHWMEPMGFGRPVADVMANPSRSPDAGNYLAESMSVLAEGLGTRIDDLTTDIKLAAATKDVPYAYGVIREGTVAGQHYEWTAWVDGAPLIKFFAVWVVGDENIEPNFASGDSRYVVRIDGDPSLELTLQAPPAADGSRPNPGIDWTALAGVTAIPDVCAAEPGFVTHLDLGLVRPRGLVRGSALAR